MGLGARRNKLHEEARQSQRPWFLKQIDAGRMQQRLPDLQGIIHRVFRIRRTVRIAPLRTTPDHQGTGEIAHRKVEPSGRLRNIAQRQGRYACQETDIGSGRRIERQLLDTAGRPK
ncbi:hypothetical protein D3C81_1898550 [compost metagenome]